MLQPASPVLLKSFLFSHNTGHGTGAHWPEHRFSFRTSWARRDKRVGRAWAARSGAC